jgi:hypothetical protein
MPPQAKHPGSPMFVAPEWIEAHCVIPDGDDRGMPFRLGDEQARFVMNHYRVRDNATPELRAPAFVFRRSQLVRAQKWGKSPLIAAFVCLEGVGPALFDGWAVGGEVYDCRSHGCGCGWSYRYEPGEPMGRQWATPLIQITATSEDQTDNTYAALRPMIELGPLGEVIPKTGEEFIRLPGAGRVEAVTSKATSRIGQRVTFVAQDETGLWTESNGGHKLASAQRRGLAGMGGRAIETTNAWDPAQDSVAQRTFESTVPDVQRDFRMPPANLSFRDKRERHRIFQFNYAGAPWVPLASVEAEAAEMLSRNAAEAERFFGNRLVAGDGAWITAADWADRISVRDRPKSEPICLGFDGSDVDDWTAIRAETFDLHQFTPVDSVGRGTVWNPAEFDGRVPRMDVLAAFDHIFASYDVVRAYVDPPGWESQVSYLQGRYGDKCVIEWPTYRIRPMHAALERFRTDITAPGSRFTHDPDKLAAMHAANAVVRPRTGQTYILGKASQPQKIDILMASAFAHEAVSDAIAAGDLGKRKVPISRFYDMTF